MTRCERPPSRRDDLQEPPDVPVPALQHITLQDLVNTGLLPDDAALEARVQGVSHMARLRDGALELDGVRYDTPSAASVALRKTKTWNGWRDWRYQGDLLADLRLRLQRPSSAKA